MTASDKEVEDIKKLLAQLRADLRALREAVSRLETILERIAVSMGVRIHG